MCVCLEAGGRLLLLIQGRRIGVSVCLCLCLPVPVPVPVRVQGRRSRMNPLFREEILYISYVIC